MSFHCGVGERPPRFGWRDVADFCSIQCIFGDLLEWPTSCRPLLTLKAVDSFENRTHGPRLPRLAESNFHGLVEYDLSHVEKNIELAAMFQSLS